MYISAEGLSVNFQNRAQFCHTVAIAAVAMAMAWGGFELRAKSFVGGVQIAPVERFDPAHTLYSVSQAVSNQLSESVSAALDMLALD
ncbi:MAG: hypothetical protein ACI93R_002194 [Flavobacteriales bacterium]|jgi:hypothetical protein